MAKRKPKAPPGSYWRGDTLWGRVKISAATSDGRYTQVTRRLRERAARLARTG
jgi:hypothetical protein